jgi:hypothetical protein
LGITAATPTEFIEKAKGIVCSHNTLKDKSSSLQEEIRRLEQEQEHLIQAKEKELLDQVTWHFKPSLLFVFLLGYFCVALAAHGDGVIDELYMVLRIRILRIRMFLGLLDPDP